MSVARAVPKTPLFAGAIIAAAALVVVALFDPKAAAAGWLVGFAFWSQILIGSLLLLMIHRLTAGHWGEIVAPALIPTAAAIPLLFLLLIPLFIAIPTLFPWSNNAAGIKPDVVSHYLNTPFFVIRSLIAIAGWSALSILLPRAAGRPGHLLAALGLAFHGIVVSSVAIDWYLSLEAPFTSSSFGASVAVTQLIAAMAWAVLLAPEADGDETIGDLGALLLAFVLGITYIDFMAVLVIWYGDLPHEEIWFVERDALPWSLLAAGTFILVSVIPAFSLMRASVRKSRIMLRMLGATLLIGLAMYDAYLIAPRFGVVSLIAAPLALLAIGFPLTAWILWGPQALLRRMRPAHVD
jgi:hypothetical protein